MPDCLLSEGCGLFFWHRYPRCRRFSHVSSARQRCRRGGLAKGGDGGRRRGLPHDGAPGARARGHGAGKDKRTDVNLETTAEDNGNLNVWTIPVVEKGERLELSFEIKGDGEVDAEVLNQFHGVTFGDEVEEDVPETSATTEEIADESEESSDEPGAGFKWREDVLLRIMAANGIDESLRDDFVRHAVNFDDDDNHYLKKAEIEAAAAAWVAAVLKSAPDPSF